MYYLVFFIFFCLIIGSLVLMGIFFLVGFFLKDVIIEVFNMFYLNVWVFVFMFIVIFFMVIYSFWIIFFVLMGYFCFNFFFLINENNFVVINFIKCFVWGSIVVGFLIILNILLLNMFVMIMFFYLKIVVMIVLILGLLMVLEFVFFMLK